MSGTCTESTPNAALNRSATWQGTSQDTTSIISSKSKRFGRHITTRAERGDTHAAFGYTATQSALGGHQREQSSRGSGYSRIANLLRTRGSFSSQPTNK